MQSAYRSDLMYSENGAESMYNLNKKAGSEGFVAPLLPSPAAQSTRTNFSYASDSSYPYFSDAVEGGHGDEEWHSGTEGDTMMTTPEKMTPAKESTHLETFAAPVRPPRRTEPLGAVSTAFVDSVDDEETADYTTVKTNVWLGTGRRDINSRSEEATSPIPMHPLTRPYSAQSCDTPVSHGGYLKEEIATEEDEQQNLSSNQEKSSTDSSSDEWLADGTKRPKMPPIPVSTFRSEKGRRNRSPVLSYADGVEEEERLERERDLQEGGGAEAIEMTSSMGPRLKKNSPAPWEMGEEPRKSSEASSISSRPSMDLKVAAASWTRPSMDSIRSRQASNSSSPPLNSVNAPSFSSSLKPVGAEATGNRSRSKSVSTQGNAGLKGLGISTAPPLPTMKKNVAAATTATSNGKIGKALRGMGSSVLASSTTSSISTSKDGTKKMQGISSEDYANTEDSSTNQSLEAPRSTRSRPAESRIVSSASSITITGHTAPATIASERPRVVSPSSNVEANKTRHPLSERKHRDHNIISSTARQDGTTDYKSAQSKKANSNLIANMPAPGAHEGVSYKLISLEEARSQQLKQSSPEKKPFRSRKQTMPSSTSDTSLDQITSSSNKEVQPVRTLKTKRSGLFRLFGKDKNDQVDVSNTPAVPPMPSMPAHQSIQPRALQRDVIPMRSEPKGEMITNEDESREEISEELLEGEDELGSLPNSMGASRRGVQASDTPALSLRPMSSMFNGLAPDLLDSLAAGSTDASSIDDRNKLQLPVSPTFAPRSPQLSSSSHGSNRSSESQGTSRKKASKSAAQPSPRRSLESMRSETSSSLGLINGSAMIPAVPTHSTDNDRIDLSLQDAAQLANSTRSRALEIEIKVADLLAELVRLRSNATDNGLLSPVMNTKVESSTLENPNDSIATSPQLSVDSNNNLSQPSSPAMSTSQLATPIAPCSSCGCNCADQKRQQMLNEIAVLKNISVLDRGRALKSLGTSANVGKFGSYLHR